MKYLQAYQDVFARILRRDDVKLFLDKSVCEEALVPILVGRAGDAARRYTGLLGADASIFVKTVRFRTPAAKLRATFGIRRGHGAYDWPINELINNLEASRRAAPIAKVLGFGVRRGLLRLTNQVILLSENLNGFIDGTQWIDDPACDLELFLLNTFELLRELNSKQVYHLDLWLGNVMLNRQQPSELKAVDLENAYIGPVANLAYALGFQFGFIYHRIVQERIDELRYDQLVESVLDRFPAFDRTQFARMYARCKHQHYSRKGRRKLVLSAVNA